jgi:hypothetical protein
MVGCLSAIAGPDASSDSWRYIADGLDIADFIVSPKASSGDSKIVVIRIDPKLWDIKLMSISETGDEKGKSAKDWCQDHKLTAAINAGMFDVDYKTHVGYMRTRTHKNSPRINGYKSAAAFDPKHDTLPPFYIYDLDVTPLDTVAKYYHGVMQNLRLIKRPGENRWSQQERKWSEAALGEDSQGRMLFIYCGSPYSMYDFNHMIMALPIDLVCAQHLEGGPLAQMYIKHGETELELAGGYANDLIQSARPIPNVLGIAPRHSK